MAFFARPNLDNTQFKQLRGGEPLTLSGQTQIATTSGLTLTDGAGGFIPIVATGATNDYVLTYDDGGPIPVIKLKQSSASGGTGTYPYDQSATTTVGGLVAGTYLYNQQVVDILQDILVPTLDPVLTNPFLFSFTISPSTTLYEIGTSISVTGTTVFNAGCICPQYTALSNCRSYGVSGYSYGIYGAPPVFTASSCPSNTCSFGSKTVGSGNNTLSVYINYSGGTQPYDSSGAPYLSGLTSGCTSTCNRTICGIYPWYWGIESSGGAASGVNRPSACCIKNVITGGTGNKCVSISTGTLNVIFGSTSDDYLWFATPCASATKTKWYVDALNNGNIGGVVSPGGNLFPTAESVTGVTTTCWSGQTYQVYVSNYQSAALLNMQLRNS